MYWNLETVSHMHVDIALLFTSQSHKLFRHNYQLLRRRNLQTIMQR